MSKLIVNRGSNLGMVAMYSLDSKLKVSIQDLRESARKNNIPNELIPNPLSPAGAFQRATTYVASTVVKNAEPIICKEVENSATRIVRVFEKRILDSTEDVEKAFDGKENIPVYTHVATMSYDKATGSILTHTFHSCGKDITRRALEKYDEIVGWHNIQQIRKMIQDGFTKYNAVALRKNGGVTFVPDCDAEPFSRFVKMCEEIQGVSILTLDIKFTASNRATITDALQDHLTETIEDEIKRLDGKTTGSKALNELVTEFGTALMAGKVKKDCLGNMVNRFQDTMKLVSKYRELLQVDLTQTEAQMELAKSQLGKVLAVAE